MQLLHREGLFWNRRTGFLLLLLFVGRLVLAAERECRRRHRLDPTLLWAGAAVARRFLLGRLRRLAAPGQLNGSAAGGRRSIHASLTRPTVRCVPGLRNGSSG